MTNPSAIRLIEESISEHVGEPGGGFGFRLIVAPAAGRMRHLPPVRFHEGDEWVSVGQPVAVVEQGNIAVEVVSPVEARVAGVLVRDGEPVLKGQPIVWLDESSRRPDGEGRDR
jgi:biotin carboxyl carrier protein